MTWYKGAAIMSPVQCRENASGIMSKMTILLGSSQPSKEKGIARKTTYTETMLSTTKRMVCGSASAGPSARQIPSATLAKKVGNRRHLRRKAFPVGKTAPISSLGAGLISLKDGTKTYPSFKGTSCASRTSNTFSVTRKTAGAEVTKFK